MNRKWPHQGVVAILTRKTGVKYDRSVRNEWRPIYRERNTV